MSQKEDILFCKIAIANGLVSEADAQKVLALCDKREREAGRRPLVGAVFTKYNLLKQQDVQKVYEALKKRTGALVGAERLTARARSGAAAVKRRAEPARASRGVDPTTLWMGIGALVVFLGIVGGMFYILMRPPPRTGQPAAAASPTDAGASSGPTREAPKKAAPAKSPTTTDIPKEVLQEVKTHIADAKSLLGDDPAQAAKHLETVKKQLEDKGYVPPKDFLDALKECQDAAKQAGSAAGAQPAPEPAGPKDAAAPSKESTKPAPEAGAPAKTGEAPADADLDKLIEETK